MIWFKSEGKINTDPDKIEEVLSRGVEEIFVKEHLKEALLSGRQLRIKLGIDPTGPAIHLGRAVVLRKLRAFQDLGHKAVLIIGDFTAKIGDPSDKLEKRPMLTDGEIKKNLKNYLEQIGKIVDVKKAEIRYNSEWLSKMDYIETAKLLECFTVQQMSRRRNFRERLDNGQDIFVVEFMYPALQGYDSVKVLADVEIGGFDQLFNLQAGRIVQKRYGQKEQDIMTVSMLEGTDGRKMSSSWGNIISILDTKEDMFGKLMAVKDELILKYFLLCTNIPISEISDFEKELKNGANPKNIKMRLAHEITKMFYGEKQADLAEENFERTFVKRGVPEEVIEVSVAKGVLFADILMVNELVVSKSDFRRLVSEGAITNMDTGQKITNNNPFVSDGTYKIGKRRFIKIKVLE